MFLPDYSSIIGSGVTTPAQLDDKHIKNILKVASKERNIPWAQEQLIWAVTIPGSNIPQRQ